MTGKSTRRDFVKQSAAVGTAFWVSGVQALSQEKTKVEKLNVACVGAEGKGSSDVDNSAHWGANIVALCDIDDNRLRKKARRHPDAELFHDYRQMLDKMDKKIDVVTVSTPDHSHAPASILAMKNGKHVYCQKPLTWSVYEARRMREVAAEMGVVTQMGNQGTSENGLREAVEIVKAGGIGDVREIHVWTNRPGRFWPQGIGRPQETPAIPKDIYWHRFLGPAAWRPYHPAYTPFKWRGWLDFGTGALGDMACHTANMVVMALDLFEPHTIEAEHSGIVQNETFPKFSTIKLEFPYRGSLPPCTLTWHDGGKLPPLELLQGKKVSKSGSLMVGSKGTLYSPNDYGAKFFLLPEDDFKEFEKPEPTLPRVETEGTHDQRHMSEFIAACKGEGKTMSNFNYAGRLTETILLGNLALRLSDPKPEGQETVSCRIEWDAENLKVKGHPEADEFINRPYREGWTI